VLHLDEAVRGQTFAGRSGRFGGAAGTSIAAHLLGLLAFLAVMRLAPATSVPPVVSTLDPTSLVFRAVDGPPGSSGDRGGNRSPTPASRAQSPGPDAMSVVVAPPPPLQPPPTIAPELTRTPDAPILPLVPMAAGAVQQIGTIAGPSGPPSEARGPGDRGVGTGPDGDGPGLPGPRRGVGPGGDGTGAVRPPQILFKTQPQYTTEAMRAKLQGSAILSGIVAPDGTLRDIRIVRSLDAVFGLDDQAIACVRQWRFRPGARGSTPVPVPVTIEVAFNLR